MIQPLPDPTDAAGYRFWSEERVRFADLDPLGHANNNAIGTYFESARVDLFAAAGGVLGTDVRATGRTVVIARLAIDFRAELHHPAQVRIGTRVLRLGRSSVTLGSAVFHDERCIATCEAVCVIIDLESRRPADIPPETRERLSMW